MKVGDWVRISGRAVGHRVLTISDSSVIMVCGVRHGPHASNYYYTFSSKCTACEVGNNDVDSFTFLLRRVSELENAVSLLMADREEL